MIVRDKLLKKSDYKGRETHALDKLCPCRPCYQAHNFGRIDRYSEKLTIDMRCALRYNRGCPSILPPAFHVMFSTRERTCKRCGKQLTKEERNAAEIREPR